MKPMAGANKAPEDRPCPFHKAASMNRRVKLFVYGESGTGKTTLGLQFPQPVLIDMEGGADHYGSKADFDVFRTTDAAEVMEMVTWLMTHRHDYKTLILDPATVYWEALQRRWSNIFLERNRTSRGYRYEFYEMQVKDWMTVKAELKDLIRRLAVLDMNVVVTARQKPQYADGAMMRVTGETFDCERSLPYLFDTVVQLYRDDKARYMARCIKDRAGNLPTEPFPCSYGVFERAFGIEALTRPSRIGQGGQPEAEPEMVLSINPNAG